MPDAREIHQRPRIEGERIVVVRVEQIVIGAHIAPLVVGPTFGPVDRWPIVGPCLCNLSLAHVVCLWQFVIVDGPVVCTFVALSLVLSWPLCRRWPICLVVGIVVGPSFDHLSWLNIVDNRHVTIPTPFRNNTKSYQIQFVDWILWSIWVCFWCFFLACASSLAGSAHPVCALPRCEMQCQDVGFVFCVLCEFFVFQTCESRSRALVHNALFIVSNPNAVFGAQRYVRKRRILNGTNRHRKDRLSGRVVGRMPSHPDWSYLLVTSAPLSFRNRLRNFVIL